MICAFLRTSCAANDEYNPNRDYYTWAWILSSKEDPADASLSQSETPRWLVLCCLWRFPGKAFACTLSLLAMQDSRNAFQQNKVCNDCNWVLRSWFTCLNNINSWSVTRDASRFQKEWASYFNLWCRDYCLFETQSTRVVTLTRPDEQQSTLIHVYTQFIDTCGHIKWTFCYACLWTTMQMWWANVRLHRTKVYYSRQIDTFFIRKTPLITSEYSDGSLMPSVVAFFSLKSRYADGCAGEGQAGLDCGASRGIDPLKCCEGLECQDGKCVFNRGGSTGCPTALVDCVSWSVSCGKCQALHWIARVINEAGDPVNEAVVRQKTTTQNGSVVGPSTKTTSPGLFSS
jgi:hypothetical protein